MQPDKNRTVPDPDLRNWPKGIRYIIGNEGCERFSYYGMNAILYVYIASLYTGMGVVDDKAADLATSTVHFFKTGVYALPMIGAIVADRFLGKYRTILWLSFVYCAGHLVLSCTEGSVSGLHIGLFLIALGSGGIKPCVSAHVGDQFGRSNWHLVDKVYQGFYFIINLGSFFSTLLIPLVQKKFGWSIAFAIPGILMFIATLIFWLGRKEFVHVPAKPGGYVGFLDATSSALLFMTLGSLFFTAHQSLWVMSVVSFSCMAGGLWVFQVRQSIAADDGFLAVFLFTLKEWFKQFALNRGEVTFASGGSGSGIIKGGQPDGSWRSNVNQQFSNEAIEGTLAVLKIISIFFLVSIFWSLFDQSTSSWIRQAEMMNRQVTLPFFGKFEILSSQIQALNPVLVMVMIPILLYGLYPWMERRGMRLSALMRMSIGMFIASVSFAMVAWIQHEIDIAVLQNQQLHVGWQFFPYVIITLAEVLVSITGLEFAYTQAPKRMKATVMGFWLLSVALGNVLVALTSRFSNLKLVNFFWVFTGLMALAALLFYVRSAFYVQRDYHQ
jgi:proton-dependent oligopeptide transporter, POT family